jgi:hypothetical protein
MYKNFKLTDKERKQILEQHKEHGYRQPLNEQSTNQRDPKRIAFFDNLAKQISSKIVGKTLPFGKIGVLDNTTIVVQKYMDRNHAVNLSGYPVKEFNLFFSVRRVQEDLYKGEKPGSRGIWTGAVQISGTFNNGKLSPRPIVELWGMKNGNIDFNVPASQPTKPWTWDMVGGADLWSTAPNVTPKTISESLTGLSMLMEPASLLAPKFAEMVRERNPSIFNESGDYEAKEKYVREFCDVLSNYLLNDFKSEDDVRASEAREKEDKIYPFA